MDRSKVMSGARRPPVIRSPLIETKKRTHGRSDQLTTRRGLAMSPVRIVGRFFVCSAGCGEHNEVQRNYFQSGRLRSTRVPYES